MHINIKASGMELTLAIRDFITEKVSQIDKLIADHPGVVAQVEVGKVTHHHKGENVFRAEIHLVGSGLNAYAVSNKSDLYLAINDAKEEIIREVNKGKGKRLAMHRRGAKVVKDMMHGIGGFSKRFWRRGN